MRDCRYLQLAARSEPTGRANARPMAGSAKSGERSLESEQSRISLSGHAFLLQKIADAFGDLAGMGFQREVAGVEEANHRAGNVTLERLGSRRQEERIVP